MAPQLCGRRRLHRRQEDPVFLVSAAQGRDDAAGKRQDHDGREGELFWLGQTSSGPFQFHLEYAASRFKVVSCVRFITYCSTRGLIDVNISSDITPITNHILIY